MNKLLKRAILAASLGALMMAGGCGDGDDAPVVANPSCTASFAATINPDGTATTPNTTTVITPLCSSGYLAGASVTLPPNTVITAKNPDGTSKALTQPLSFTFTAPADSTATFSGIHGVPAPTGFTTLVSTSGAIDLQITGAASTTFNPDITITMPVPGKAFGGLVKVYTVQGTEYTLLGTFLVAIGKVVSFPVSSLSWKVGDPSPEPGAPPTVLTTAPTTVGPTTTVPTTTPTTVGPTTTAPTTTTTVGPISTAPTTTTTTVGPISTVPSTTPTTVGPTTTALTTTTTTVGPTTTAPTTTPTTFGPTTTVPSTTPTTVGPISTVPTTAPTTVGPTTTAPTTTPTTVGPTTTVPSTAPTTVAPTTTVPTTTPTTVGPTTTVPSTAPTTVAPTTTVPTTAPTTTTTTVLTTVPTTITTTVAPLDGQALFASNCQLCHGPLASTDPHIPSDTTVSEIRGVPDHPAFTLSDAQLQAIIGVLP